MKLTWRTEWPIWALILGMFLLAAVSWSTAPDRIPTHWGWNGQVDRYSGKFEGLLLMPILATVVYLLLTFLPRVDPGRANYEQFAGAYLMIRASAVTIMAAIYGVIHLVIRGHAVRIDTIVPLLVGGLLTIVGSVLGKIRPNWFVGVRTPWTLSSKLSWTKTHRAAGWVFVVLGLSMMASGVSRSRAAFIATIAFGAIGVVGTMIYSYLVWRRDPERIPPAGTLPAE